jgi:SOS response regulatory protein OraA/RecX
MSMNEFELKILTNKEFREKVKTELTKWQEKRAITAVLQKRGFRASMTVKC